MTYWEYQQYLADGGWQAMSTRNAQIAKLTEEVSALTDRVTALEDDRFMQRVIGWLVLAVVGAAFVLAMTGVP